MTAQAPVRSAALAGIGLMLLGVFLFSLNDAVGKWLVSTYSVGQLLLIRSATTLILLSPFIWRAGVAAFRRAPRPGLQVLRVVLSSLEVAMFFWAVQAMPLADAITFYLAGPIYVTALSVWLLGERVGWRRWTAVLIGFCGVVIALRPSTASITLPALIALCGSLFYALLLVTTRMVKETNDTVLMSGQFFGSFAFGALTAPFGWVTPSAYDLMFLSGFGVVSIAALFCINRSLKLAPASVVVPYQYSLIVWSVLLGWWVFGEWPDAWTITGGTIIVAAGLYIFWREQVTAREASFTPAPRPEAP
jgi:drug/metabolite transporter (DMT)-like permease